MSGLKMLYISKDVVHFRLKKDDAVYYFELLQDGSYASSAYVYTTEPEEEDLDNEGEMTEQDFAAIELARKEAAVIAKNQLQTWAGLSLTEKLGLKISWHEDLYTEIESELRACFNEGALRENVDEIRELSEELMLLEAYIEGLKDALSE